MALFNRDEIEAIAAEARKQNEGGYVSQNLSKLRRHLQKFDSLKGAVIDGQLGDRGTPFSAVPLGLEACRVKPSVKTLGYSQMFLRNIPKPPTQVVSRFPAVNLFAHHPLLIIPGDRVR